MYVGMCLQNLVVTLVTKRFLKIVYETFIINNSSPDEHFNLHLPRHRLVSSFAEAFVTSHLKVISSPIASTYYLAYLGVSCVCQQ